MLRGQAQACVLIWLGGGMCHVDTFDPKPLGDAQAGKPGSAYSSIPTAIDGVQVCVHLKRTADFLDRGVILRTVNHSLNVDHADSTNLLKTGRVTSGTIVYPSLGSMITHQLGPRELTIPPYVVMGLPNVTRGPGFLGARHSYLYLTDTEAGPVGLRRPLDVTSARQKRRFELLGLLRQNHLRRTGHVAAAREYDEVLGQAYRLSQGDFPKAFDLQQESDSVRERYGSDFGQRCLLARRLIEVGVRFVEVAYHLNFVNGTGWDTHRHGQRNQHLLIQDLDQSLTALLEDLQRRGMLEETLVVVATEFGRPPDFDAQGGRGHQSAAFSTVLFGGGLRSGQVIGATDEVGRQIIDRPISVPDLHASIFAALGIDPAEEVYADERPVPLTDHGRPVQELFG